MKILLFCFSFGGCFAGLFQDVTVLLCYKKGKGSKPERRNKMAKQKNIFKTLKNYGDGFHGNNSAESNAIYDAKISEVTARILADVEHAPEIIADEFGKCEARKWREAFTNGYLTPKHDSEWAAINHISYALMDSKPLDKSEPKEIKTHADLVAFMVETEEYNEQGATEAIKNYMDERIAEGMTVAAAFRATIEFMQNTLGDN